MGKFDWERKYEKWCEGKTINDKIIKGVVCYGPPSFVYGTAVIILEDNSEVRVLSYGAFKPRKKDFERLFDKKEK